jgi:mRNA degradation ribonuclease J1/J2
MANEALKVLPLGGLGEVGKNMMVLETEQDIVVIDAGVLFPEDDMPGIDIVIPNIDYLVENIDRVRRSYRRVAAHHGSAAGTDLRARNGDGVDPQQTA